MARYTGPVCRLCRRETRKLFLKGERCEGPKCAINKRNYPPGQHGGGRRGRTKVSPYARQLREKQKAKRIYGVLEKQFLLYFKIADRYRGVTGTNLLQLLESRLDNMVFRLGFAPSHSAARQLIAHGHVTVSDRKVDIPSFRVKVGQEISLKPKMREHAMVKTSLDKSERDGRLSWLEFSGEAMSGKMLSIPSRQEIPIELDEQLIVELYSK